MIIDLLRSSQSIDKRDRLHADDLLATLDKKNLRKFQNLQKALSSKKIIKPIKEIFIKAETIEFRGDFIGFLNSIHITRKIKFYSIIFYSIKRCDYFNICIQHKKIKPIYKELFFQSNGYGHKN